MVPGDRLEGESRIFPGEILHLNAIIGIVVNDSSG